VPANRHQGLHQEEVARRGWAVTAEAALGMIGRDEIEFVDLRETSEREKHGIIPGSLHAPYTELVAHLHPRGALQGLADKGKRILFYCAFGERSAMAVQAAQDAGIRTAKHIEGGMDAWKKACGPIER
jgi:sulfur dioxygenase